MNYLSAYLYTLKYGALPFSIGSGIYVGNTVNKQYYVFDTPTTIEGVTTTDRIGAGCIAFIGVSILGIVWPISLSAYIYLMTYCQPKSK